MLRFFYFNKYFFVSRSIDNTNSQSVGFFLNLIYVKTHNLIQFDIFFKWNGRF